MSIHLWGCQRESSTIGTAFARLAKAKRFIADVKRTCCQYLISDAGMAYQRESVCAYTTSLSKPYLRGSQSLDTAWTRAKSKLVVLIGGKERETDGRSKALDRKEHRVGFLPAYSVTLYSARTKRSSASMVVQRRSQLTAYRPMLGVSAGVIDSLFPRPEFSYSTIPYTLYPLWPQEF